MQAASLRSGMSGIVQHRLVNPMNNFNCGAMNERSVSVVHNEVQEHDASSHKYQGRIGSHGDIAITTSMHSSSNGSGTSSRDRSRGRQKISKSFREYSKSCGNVL